MNQRIDRKTAARQLKVSIRTVDRYISQKKLSIEKEQGRIWLYKKEVSDIKRKMNVDNEVDSALTRKKRMSIDSIVSTPVDVSIDGVDIVSTSEVEKRGEGKQKTESGIYKKLYEELQEELKIKQDRLEGANYRVGQLESMVKESVPMLEHQKLLSTEKAVRLELEEETESLREKIEKLANHLKDEKLNRKVYMVVLFIIMLLQPLWFLLYLK